MRRFVAVLAVLAALAFLLAGSGAAAESRTPAATPPTAAPRDGWPDTPAGRTARGWVTAFSSGEKAMREFLAGTLTQESLARRSMDERMVTYRENRETLGKLTLGSVVQSTPTELTVSLLDSDLASHEFVFTVQADAPHRLVSVAIRQRTHGSHLGGMFHH